MDHQMKGEYFKMKNHGLRRIFSLFLALFMVFTLLPTTALAEDTTGADETQPKTVVVDEGEKKTDPPAQEQPKNENPPAPEEPKTFTVTYTDGVGGAVFDNEVYSNLSSGTATPAFSGSLAREGYTFVGWNPAVAETVTADVTYAAKWEEGKTGPRRVTVPTIPGPGVAPAALDTGHKIDVRFTVLYVGDEFNIGYNYGSSEKTKFVCQYKTNHSDTAYNNHTIAISDIKAAASRASVNSGYQIVGWSKESNANPTTWSLNKSGTTACNKGTTIYLVAKNPNPTTKYTYTLNYDANGGTGAPSADSWSTTDAAIRYHSFTVKNTIPTREGYVFKGWKANDGSDTIYTGGMTCAVSQYGNDVVKNGNTWTRTLYAVWEKAVPSKPQWSDIRGEMQKVSVHVTCSNPDVNHTEKTYSYKESNDDTIGSVQDSAGSYTCTVTVHLGRYRLQYNQDFNREHEFASSLTADVVLQYNGTGWVIASALPLELKLTCGSAPTPNPPGSDVLNSLKVLVKCDSKTYHFEEPYKMDDGDYRLEKVDDNTYTVIVLADKYVEKYNAVYPGHTLFDNNTKTIKLVYRYGAWTVVGSNGVTFNVSCEQKYTVTYTDGVDGEVIFKDQVYYKKPGEKTPEFRGTPTRPGYIFIGWDPEVAEAVTENATYTAVWEAAQPALPDAIFGSFTMKCVTPNANHYCREGVDIELAPLNAYTNSGVKTDDSGDTPVYYFELTVDAEKYLSQYDRKAAVSGKEPVEHTICAGQEPTVIRFNWNGSSWVQGNKPVVNAECKTEPEKPSGDIVKRLIDVQVVCGNIDHSVTTSSLNDDTFDTGNVTKEGDKYTCVITVHAGSYINEYNATNPGHVLTPGSRADLTVRLVHNGSDWTLEDSRTDMMHVVFNVSDTYTVTYTDGVENEEIFADQNHAGLLSGTATPAFNGTPTRTGYIFGGWDPEVAETVTGNAIYTATWKVDANGNGIADDLEDKFTVTYTDGVENEEIFADQVYGNLLSGTATPAFNGTPTRKGYVFTGWNPAVAAIVTGDATYTAVWEEDANGNGTPDKEEEKYTVSYTDGVENEEIFADQVYGNLLSGTATPAFNGTPTRAGYKFLGWEPTVAETVTENATYVAQWEKLYTVTYTDGVGGKAFKDDVHSDLEKDTKTPAYKDGIPTRKGFKFLGWEPEVADTVTEDVTYTAKWGELYTVTYTDGAKGKAFEDQVYEDILSGTKTPKFDGTPTREGYKFVGWEPEVAETVTKNVTYTAKWEKLYTVTYTDGVKGKAFKDQVYSDLEAGTDTPKFDGKPTRKGYTFTGWSPKVTDTVTKDVTYVAQWKSVKNGKDNIPKTGDSEIVMVLGSVLLFSFCGAAAVSVYDRKRKHF